MLHMVVINNLHASGSHALQGKPDHRRVGEHGEIRSVHIGKCIRAENGLALSITRPDVLDRASTRAFLHAAVGIFKSRNSRRSRSLRHGTKDRIAHSPGLAINSSSCSTVFRTPPPTPIFN